MCEDIFCEGQIDFDITCSTGSVTGYVKIPKQEFSMSDDDFEIYFNTESGIQEDCDCHMEIPQVIEEYMYGGGFLEYVCDNAHKNDSKECIELGQNEFLSIQIWSDGFKWDVDE